MALKSNLNETSKFHFVKCWKKNNMRKYCLKNFEWLLLSTISELLHSGSKLSFSIGFCWCNFGTCNTIPEWAKMIPILRVETLKNHTVSVSTYLSSPYLNPTPGCDHSNETSWAVLSHGTSNYLLNSEKKTCFRAFKISNLKKDSLLYRNTPKIEHPNNDLYPFYKCSFHSNQ